MFQWIRNALKRPNKTEEILQQMLNKQTQLLDSSMAVKQMLEAGFNSANLLAMKESLDRIEQKVSELNEIKVAINSLSQQMQDMKSHIAELTGVIHKLIDKIGPQPSLTLPIELVKTRPTKHRVAEITTYLGNKYQSGQEFAASEITHVFNLNPKSTWQFLNKRLLPTSIIQKIDANRYRWIGSSKKIDADRPT